MIRLKVFLILSWNFYIIVPRVLIKLAKSPEPLHCAAAGARRHWWPGCSLLLPCFSALVRNIYNYFFYFKFQHKMVTHVFFDKLFSQQASFFTNFFSTSFFLVNFFSWKSFFLTSFLVYKLFSRRAFFLTNLFLDKLLTRQASLLISFNFLKR
jgi:hypothetical protein